MSWKVIQEKVTQEVQGVQVLSLKKYVPALLSHTQILQSKVISKDFMKDMSQYR